MHIVIMSAPNCPPIHCGAIQAANPYTSMSVYYEERFTDRYPLWRNADRMIRNWWKQNRSCFPYEKQFVILEWDVYANVKFDSSFEGVVGNKIHTTGDRWQWFAESNRLYLGMKPIGLSPLCVLMMDRYALEDLIQPCFDALYSKDIFCELRLPSVLNHTNNKISELDLPTILSSPVTPNGPGIYHSVKQPVK